MEWIKISDALPKFNKENSDHEYLISDGYTSFICYWNGKQWLDFMGKDLGEELNPSFWFKIPKVSDELMRR
jgi:hypothetical protein